jgi:hypothetical protein
VWLNYNLLQQKECLMKLKPLAVAIGVALPVSALASTLTDSPVTASNEYLVAEAGIQGGAVTYALGASPALNDVFTFTYSAPARAGTSGTGITSFANTLTIDQTGGTNGTDGTLSLFDSSDTSVSYRVTALPAGGDVSAGDYTVAVPQPIFQQSDIGTSDVTVTASAATAAGTNYDSLRGGAATMVDQTGSQFAFAVTGLSEIVDVESLLKEFAIGANTASTAAFTVVQSTAVSNNGTAATNLASGATIAVTLTGDFAWLDSDTSATGIQTGAVSFGSAGSGPAVVTANSMTLTLVTGGDSVTFANVAEADIPTQTLSMSLSGAILGNAATSAHTGTATGAYTLNGSTVTVYAIPTSAAASNFIWLTNSGTSDGGVSLTVHDAGTDIALGNVGTSEAGSEFDVSAALNDALEAQGVTLSGGRVHMDIVTNVPAADVAVSAAYRVGDDRVNLVTSLETDND